MKGLVPFTVVALLAVATAPLGAGAQPLPETVTPRLTNSILGAGQAAQIHVIALTDGHPAPIADLARQQGFEIGWVYDIIDGFSLKLPLARLPELANLPGIIELWDDAPVTTLLDNSAKAIRADHAWNAGYTGAGTTVAVLDTGIDPVDPAFPAGTIVACVSTIGPVVTPECTDSDGHGTHTAAIVASRDPVFKGVAHGANLAVVRVLHAAGTGLSSDLIAGIDWVGNHHDLVTPNIRVTTMGAGFSSASCGDGQDPEAKAADALVAKGVSFTVAAGNSGHATCTVDGASAAFNVVTVGAADDKGTTNRADDLLVPSSSGGPTADGRLKPDILAPGVGITAPYLGPAYGTLSGTSVATPHVAGAIALYLEKYPTGPASTPAAIKSAIISSAYAPPGAPAFPNNDWGHGLLDVCRMMGLSGC